MKQSCPPLVPLCRMAITPPCHLGLPLLSLTPCPGSRILVPRLISLSYTYHRKSTIHITLSLLQRPLDWTSSY